MLSAKRARLKRKLISGSSDAPSKRQRREVSSLNDLPWKTLSKPSQAGFEGDDGILWLEEVDNVEVVYEETEKGRVAKFKVRSVRTVENAEP